MRQHTPSPRRREPARSRMTALPGLALAACALFAAGCEEEQHVGGPKRSRVADAVGVDQGDLDRPAARPSAKKPTNSGPIIGQKTSDIKDANAELKTGKAQVASTRIVARDPITLSGNAYVSAIGQLASGQIKHAMDLYQATNGEYPKDYNEFMTGVIKANNLSLPKLPPYQEYSYDAKEHKLIILEYPDRKNQPVR